MRSTSVCVLVQIAYFPLLIAVARGGDGAADERLPGSRVSLRDAVQSSQWVVVAKDVDMGVRSPSVSLMRLSYPRVKLVVVKSLKGDAPQKISRMEVRRMLPMSAESLPVQDQEYLFFLDVNLHRQVEAIKILQATDEHLRATLEVMEALDEHLPGSQLSLRNAARLSERLVQARVVDQGGPSPEEDPGKRCYDHVRLKVVKFMWRADTAPDAAPAEFLVVRVPLVVGPGAEEVIPEEGQEYLFFLDEVLPGLTEAVKVLRATDEHIRAAGEAATRYGR